MSGLKLLGLLGCVLLGLNLSAQQAYTPATVPDPKSGGTGYVSNPDGVLDAASVLAINQALTALEDSLRMQVAVVAVQSIGSAVPRDFATELFNRWKVGYKGLDNGLLLLVVLDQKRWEIETGYGLEPLLPDAAARRLGEEALVPQFRQGNYGQGVADFCTRLAQLMSDAGARQEFVNAQSQQVYDETHGWWGRNWVWIRWYVYAGGLLSAVALVLCVVALLSPGPLYKRYLRLRPLGLWIWAFIFTIPYLPGFAAVRLVLRYLRRAPRSSPTSGKPMTRLDEDQDNVFLEAGQIKEEKLKSIDYDVWQVPGDRQDVLVLPYKNFGSQYIACSKCKYRTAYSYSQTVVAPTYDSTGQGKRTTTCKHCGHSTVSYYTIARLQRSSSSGGGSSGGGGSSSWGGGSSGGGGAGGSW